MLIIPAIDLKDGQCVRLKQGLMEESTVFSEDPGAMARHWVDQGGKRLHLVDLNGAFAGKPVNEGAYCRRAQSIRRLRARNQKLFSSSAASSANIVGSKPSDCAASSGASARNPARRCG